MNAAQDSENALLGIIAQNPQWALKNAPQLSPVLFDYEPCRLIYEAITECGTEWDMARVTNVLRIRGKLDYVGGAAGVSEYFVSFPVQGMAEYHLKTVRDAATLRRALQMHKNAQVQLTSALVSGVENASEIIASIRDEMEHLCKLPGQRLKRLTMGQATELVINGIDQRAMSPGSIPGWTTGFAKIDRITMGMQPGHVWIFCGGPGDGKSTLMQNCAEGALAAGARLGIYQLEMPIDEQAFRFLTSVSKVDSDRLWMGQITPEDQMAISAASRRLKKVGADLIDTDDVTASDILADIEQADYDVVMLDYLQLLDEPQGKSETREMVVSRISRRLKKLAKKKGITILSGSQLNDDGRLRESRAIGQDADKVMRIARFVDKNNLEHDDRRKLEFLKNRGGKRNIVLPMLFQGQFYKFREDPDPAAISG